MSEQTETAILAGGCFWPAQQLLRHRDGVISTRVGYTGGENDNPTAHDHPGHAEAVEVIFDPERTRYRDILEFFFQIHRPDLGKRLVGSGSRSRRRCIRRECRSRRRGGAAVPARARNSPLAGQRSCQPRLTSLVSLLLPTSVLSARLASWSTSRRDEALP